MPLATGHQLTSQPAYFVTRVFQPDVSPGLGNWKRAKHAPCVPPNHRPGACSGDCPSFAFSVRIDCSLPVLCLVWEPEDGTGQFDVHPALKQNKSKTRHKLERTNRGQSTLQLGQSQSLHPCASRCALTRANRCQKPFTSPAGQPLFPCAALRCRAKLVWLKWQPTAVRCVVLQG